MKFHEISEDCIRMSPTLKRIVEDLDHLYLDEFFKSQGMKRGIFVVDPKFSYYECVRDFNRGIVVEIPLLKRETVYNIDHYILWYLDRPDDEYVFTIEDHLRVTELKRIFNNHKKTENDAYKRIARRVDN
jgi:hypothetical protein